MTAALSSMSAITHYCGLEPVIVPLMSRLRQFTGVTLVALLAMIYCQLLNVTVIIDNGKICSSLNMNFVHRPLYTSADR